MRCLRCRHDNPQDAAFCEACGAGVARCASCRQVLGEGAHFCGHCGAAVPGALVAAASVLDGAPSGDRRQAALLFVDISGYTAMCRDSDPEPIQEMLQAFFSAMEGIVSSHGGHVLDRVGDAVAAVFGAPLAYGNDRLRAARAALSMQNAAAGLVDPFARALRLHIGVASGEVVAASLEGAGRAKYSVTGEPVNLAARLAAVAAPGEILISAALREDLASAVEVAPVAALALKGFAEPVPAWRLVAIGSTVAGGTRFVGRHSELRQLEGALQALREGGSGSTIVVRGDAGIGKSRLVRELVRSAVERDISASCGFVLDFGVGQGQNALAQIVRSLLDIEPAGGSDLEGLCDAVRRGLVNDAERVFLEEWLGIAEPGRLGEMLSPVDSGSRWRRESETLTALVERVTATGPRLIVIEDVHWASPELVRLVSSLAGVTARTRSLLLLTTRADGDPLDKAWRVAARDAALAVVDLCPLRDSEARTLADAFGHGSGDFAARCIERAEGNPLFLEQLLRSGSSDPAACLAAGAVPPTIQSLVLARLDRLGAEDRELLQAAAVIGKRFSASDVGGLRGSGPADFRQAESADLVRRHGADFIFAHALVHEAIYAATLKSRRRRLHRDAAGWFGSAEPVLQAEHLDRADDPAAAAACLHAAEQETERQRFESALRLARRGEELAERAERPEGDALRSRSRLLQGEVLRDLGRSTESIAAFRSVLDVATDDEARCRAWMGIAAIHRVTGGFDAAMDALDQASTLAERLPHSQARSRIHHTRGNLYFSQGRIVECEAQHREALAHAEQSGHAEAQARAFSGLGDACYAQGRMGSALEHFKRCVELAGPQIAIAGPNRCMTGHCLWYQNQVQAALGAVQSARDDARRLGAVTVLIFAQTSFTQLLTEAGRFDDAAAACEEALALARSAGSRRYEATLLLFGAERHVRNADFELAAEELDRGLALARETGLGFVGAPLLARRARTVGSAAQRCALLAEGQAVLAQTGLAHSHFWFYRDAIEASLEAAAWSDALAYAVRLEQAFNTEDLPWSRLMVARARAIVAARQASRSCEERMFDLAAVRLAAVAAGNGWALAGIDRESVRLEAASGPGGS